MTVHRTAASTLAEVDAVGKLADAGLAGTEIGMRLGLPPRTVSRRLARYRAAAAARAAAEAARAATPAPLAPSEADAPLANDLRTAVRVCLSRAAEADRRGRELAKDPNAEADRRTAVREAQAWLKTAATVAAKIANVETEEPDDDDPFGLENDGDA